MRFKGWPDVSNTKSLVVEISQWWKLVLIHVINEWKTIQYFACRLEILLTTAIKFSTYVNYAVDETRTKNPVIPKGKNNRFDHTDLFGYVSGKEVEDF